MSQKAKNQMNQSVYKALQDLGLSAEEIELYTLSIKIGPSPISELAKHLNLSRPSVYKLIGALENKGLINEKNKKKYSRSFIVEPPTVVLDLMRLKKQNIGEDINSLVSFMPELLADYHQGAAAAKVKIYEGEEGFLKLFNLVNEESKDENKFFGSADGFVNIVSWARERDSIKDRVRKRICVKALVLPGKAAEELKTSDERELRKTRILKIDNQFESSFTLFANKIIFWQPAAPLAILIEDEYLEKMLGAMFDTLWQQAK